MDAHIFKEMNMYDIRVEKTHLNRQIYTGIISNFIKKKKKFILLLLFEF